MRKPVVCIVGRPNVGKSTLFNKLIRKRIAITEDTPGVTRDRLYFDCEWQNKVFTLIDTGGLEIGKTDFIAENIRKQAEVAIEESDVIVFAVDAITGIINDDLELANILRKSDKPIIVAVNKIDFKKAKDNVMDFYELGFDNIVNISAEQGKGLGDLLEEIINNINYETFNFEETDITKIAIIGKPNVGKSSLVNRLLGEERMIVTDIAGTTRDATDTYYKNGDEEYILIDTAGLRRKRAVVEDIERYSVVRTLLAVDRSDICVLMIDATSGVSEQDSKIAGYAHDNGKGILILINKWDLVEKDNKTCYNFEKEIREKLGFIPYAPILFVSVKSGQRIDKIFELIKIIENNYNLRIKTGLLNSIINEAVLMKSPPTDKGKRLKIFYAVQTQVRPPTFLIFINNEELMHFSYLRYLENQIRKNFEFKGVPIRLELKTRGENQ